MAAAVWTNLMLLYNDTLIHSPSTFFLIERTLECWCEAGRRTGIHTLMCWCEPMFLKTWASCGSMYITETHSQTHTHTANFESFGMWVPWGPRSQETTPPLSLPFSCSLHNDFLVASFCHISLHILGQIVAGPLSMNYSVLQNYMP